MFVTSGAATGKYAYWGPYAVSKAGLEALVKTYAHELDDYPRARQPRQPRPGAHGDARQGVPRRGSGDAAGAGGRGAAVRLELRFARPADNGRTIVLSGMSLKAVRGKTAPAPPQRWSHSPRERSAQSTLNRTR